MNNYLRIAASAVAIDLLCAVAPVFAQAPSILLEARNQMEPAVKRMECLQAANQQRATAGKSSAAAGTTSAPSPASSLYSAPASTPRAASGSQTCHVGPRGGTYTITSSGRKNYGGC